MKPIASLFLLLPSLLSAQGWVQLADVPVDLTFPVVVELQGAIHVIGGGGPGGATDLHLRYTPATDAWDTLAPVPYLAQQPCGAVVDGKIHYCAGGYPNTGTPLDDHYIYDPAADSWYAAASLPFPTAINEAAGLDGKLYVLSGQPDKFLCQYYDPGTDLWSPLNDLPDDKFWYSALVSDGGTLYRFGGGGYTAPVDFGRVYDKVNDSWGPIADLPDATHAPAGTVLAPGLLCIAGGYSNFADLDAVWLYDIAAQSFTAAEPLPSARSYHSLVTVDGCVYSVGGTGPDPDTGVQLLRHCSLGVGMDESVEPRPYTLMMDNSTLHLQVNTTGAISLRVMDASGRVLLSRAVRGSITLHAADLAAGVMLVAVDVDGRRWVERWMAGDQ